MLNFCRDYAKKVASGEIILIGGLSRSGKTTFANNLRLTILERGLSVSTLSLDWWIKSIDSREPGVLGRYNLSVLQDVIAVHSIKKIPYQIIKLPFYDKLHQLSNLSDQCIQVQSSDILIIEGTVALTLKHNIPLIKSLYISIDETVRKCRVIEEYLSRGKNLSEAQNIYESRQIDEYPIIEKSSIGIEKFQNKKY